MAQDVDTEVQSIEEPIELPARPNLKEEKAPAEDLNSLELGRKKPVQLYRAELAEQANALDGVRNNTQIKDDWKFYSARAQVIADTFDDPGIQEAAHLAASDFTAFRLFHLSDLVAKAGFFFSHERDLPVLTPIQRSAILPNSPELVELVGESLSESQRAYYVVSLPNPGASERSVFLGRSFGSSAFVNEAAVKQLKEFYSSSRFPYLQNESLEEAIEGIASNEIMHKYLKGIGFRVGGEHKHWTWPGLESPENKLPSSKEVEEFLSDSINTNLSNQAISRVGLESLLFAGLEDAFRRSSENGGEKFGFMNPVRETYRLSFGQMAEAMQEAYDASGAELSFEVRYEQALSQRVEHLRSPDGADETNRLLNEFAVEVVNEVYNSGGFGSIRDVYLEVGIELRQKIHKRLQHQRASNLQGVALDNFKRSRDTLDAIDLVATTQMASNTEEQRTIVSEVREAFDVDRREIDPESNLNLFRANFVETYRQLSSDAQDSVREIVKFLSSRPDFNPEVANEASVLLTSLSRSDETQAP